MARKERRKKKELKESGITPETAFMHETAEAVEYRHGKKRKNKKLHLLAGMSSIKIRNTMLIRKEFNTCLLWR